MWKKQTKQNKRASQRNRDMLCSVGQSVSVGSAPPPGLPLLKKRNQPSKMSAKNEQNTVVTTRGDEDGRRLT